MTPREFTQYTGVQVSNDEFWAINEVYNNSEVTKEEFCKMWCKMNCNRVALAKEKAQREAKREAVMEKAICILLKIEKQMDEYNREGEIYKSAVLNEREKSFLLRSDLVLDSSFDCSAGGLYFIIKTNLNCI